MIEIVVHGLPAPQGSKRHVGKGIMVESSKHVKPWREAVKHATIDVMQSCNVKMLTSPVRVSFTFLFSRPKCHYGTGKNSGIVKGSAPLYNQIKPDLSKLVRSTEDALVDAGIIRDDCLIASFSATKEYTTLGNYAILRITPIEESF